MKILNSYKNGNYSVTILEDGTKIRYSKDDEFNAEFPENIDIKLTNMCNVGCSYCTLPDTEIITNNYKSEKISNLSENDEVTSFNHNMLSTETENVNTLYINDFDGELIVIETEDGKILKLTPNHKVFTVNRGYVRADNLTLEDEVLVYDEKSKKSL